MSSRGPPFSLCPWIFSIFRRQCTVTIIAQCMITTEPQLLLIRCHCKLRGMLARHGRPCRSWFKLFFTVAHFVRNKESIALLAVLTKKVAPFLAPDRPCLWNEAKQNILVVYFTRVGLCWRVCNRFLVIVTFCRIMILRQVENRTAIIQSHNFVISP